MSPKSLNELDLKPDALPTAGQVLDDLPTFGTFAPPPQPGPYRFQLPAQLTQIWEPYDTPGKTPPQRIRAIFDRDHPLLIKQAKDPKDIGNPFETRLSNEERPRNKDKTIVASDMDYLLRALGAKNSPRSNREYAEALQAHGGKEFGADMRYSWQCSDKRNIRVAVLDPTTKQRTGVQEVEGKLGCGNSYYNEDVPNNPDGSKPYEITCQCGALLRAFANLENFRA